MIPKGLTKFVSIHYRLLVLGTVLAGSIAAAVVVFANVTPVREEVAAPLAQNKYVSFTREVYDQIQKHYWNKIGDEVLSNYYNLAVNQVSGKTYIVATTTKDATLEMVEAAISELREEERVMFTKQVNSLVVNTLEPTHRNKLFTKQQERQLRDIAANINPKRDLYAYLGLEKGVAVEDVEKQYNEKSVELAKQEKELESEEVAAPTPEKKQEIEKKRQQIVQQKKQVEEAKNVLTDTNRKQRYDTYGSEPTVFARTLTSDIFHIKVKRMSPTTLQEFVEAANSTSNDPALTTLIFDLRGNIGGILDILPHFLGPFIGLDTVAFELYRYDEKEPVKTKTGWLNSLVKFKRVVVLIDNKSKSTAEVMASALKKYNVGVLVGETTQGWGTIENTYPIETQITPTEKHTLLLVNSLTLRPDGTPIEGRGVDPHVSVKKQNWQEELRKYYRDQDLIDLVATLIEEG